MGSAYDAWLTRDPAFNEDAAKEEHSPERTDAARQPGAQIHDDRVGEEEIEPMSEPEEDEEHEPTQDELDQELELPERPPLDVTAECAVTFASKGVGRLVLHQAAMLLVDRVERDARSRLVELVDRKLKESWADHLDRMVREYLEKELTKPRPRTNQYGESTGESVSIAALLEDETKRLLGRKVDAYGRTDNYGSGKQPWSQHVLSQLLDGHLKELLDKTAKEVTESARAHVRARLGQFLAEQLVPSVETPKLTG